MVACASAVEQELPYRHVGAVEQLVRLRVLRQLVRQLVTDDACSVPLLARYLPLFVAGRWERLTRWAAARTNESQLAGGRRFKLAVCAATSACSRWFQRAIARVLGRANSHSSHRGLSTTCRTCAPHPSVDARTNRQRSRTTGLLLPMVAIRAFGWVFSMSTDHLAGGAPPVFEGADSGSDLSETQYLEAIGSDNDCPGCAYHRASQPRPQPCELARHATISLPGRTRGLPRPPRDGNLS